MRIVAPRNAALEILRHNPSVSRADALRRAGFNTKAEVRYGFFAFAAAAAAASAFSISAV
jgi:hypothetical protein